MSALTPEQIQDGRRLQQEATFDQGKGGIAVDPDGLQRQVDWLLTHADTLLAAAESVGKLEQERDEWKAETVRVRPKHDAYERVCQSLGIEHDILGFVASLRAQLQAREQENEQLREDNRHSVTAEEITHENLQREIREHAEAKAEVERLTELLGRAHDVIYDRTDHPILAELQAALTPAVSPQTTAGDK